MNQEFFCMYYISMDISTDIPLHNLCTLRSLNLDITKQYNYNIQIVYDWQLPDLNAVHIRKFTRSK